MLIRFKSADCSAVCVTRKKRKQEEREPEQEAVDQMLLRLGAKYMTWNRESITLNALTLGHLETCHGSERFEQDLTGASAGSLRLLTVTLFVSIHVLCDLCFREGKRLNTVCVLDAGPMSAALKKSHFCSRFYCVCQCSQLSSSNPDICLHV